MARSKDDFTAAEAVAGATGSGFSGVEEQAARIAADDAAKRRERSIGKLPERFSKQRG
jgi:hypothetical protein